MCRFVRFRFSWLKHTLESAAFRKTRCRAMSMPV